MHAQDLVIDERGDRQLLEDVDEFFEQPAIFLILLCQRYLRLAFPFEQ